MDEFETPKSTRDADKIGLSSPPAAGATKPSSAETPSQIDTFLARAAEVAKSDHEVLQEYLREKQAVAAAAAEPQPELPQPELPQADTAGGLSRRGMLWATAGTAIAGSAGALAYAAGQTPALGAAPPGNAPVIEEPQREPIARQLVDIQGGVGGKSLGKWIALLDRKSVV